MCTSRLSLLPLSNRWQSRVILMIYTTRRVIFMCACALYDYPSLLKRQAVCISVLCYFSIFDCGRCWGFLCGLKSSTFCKSLIIKQQKLTKEHQMWNAKSEQETDFTSPVQKNSNLKAQLVRIIRWMLPRIGNKIAFSRLKEEEISPSALSSVSHIWQTVLQRILDTQMREKETWLTIIDLDFNLKKTQQQLKYNVPVKVIVALCWEVNHLYYFEGLNFFSRF